MSRCIPDEPLPIAVVLIFCSFAAATPSTPSMCDITPTAERLLHLLWCLLKSQSSAEHEKDMTISKGREVGKLKE